MMKRAFRPIAIVLSLLLLASVPAQASPVTLNDVVQVISGNPRYGGQAPIMQLRYTTQEDNTQKSGAASPATQQQSENVAPQQDASAPQQTQQAQSEEVGEIEVGDCECGELPDEIVEIPGGRSKLPFLALVPLICVTGICSGGGTPTPTPTSTPPPPEVPEPATLLLFGSGLAILGAGARRRYARAKLAQQTTITEG